jgi:drug/metabolite transporter (DMT)-like permease
MNKLYLAIPAFFDLITSCFQVISIQFISASLYIMLRGGSVISVYLISVFYLKSSVKKYQTFGVMFVILGIIIVGINDTYFLSH